MQSPQETPNEDWDEISVQEIQDLVKKVEEFYAERDSPRINAIWLADIIIKRLQNDLDYFVNCEGQKGFGKSNMMLLLGLLQTRYAGIWRNKVTGKVVRVLPRTSPLGEEWEHIKCGFSFKNNMSFQDDTEVLKQKYNSIDRFHPFIIDEGSKNLHKYGWQTKLQFMLIKLSDTERFQNKAFYICFPNFRELNSVFRNDRIMMRVYLYGRNAAKNYASAVFTLRDVNRYVMDPWHTEENAKAFEYHLRRVPAATRNASHILYAEKKLKGYGGNLEVPSLKKLAPRIWSIYMKYKIDSAKREMSEDLTPKQQDSKNMQKWKLATKRVILLLKEKHPDITWKKLKELTGMSQLVLTDLANNELDLERDIKVTASLVKKTFDPEEYGFQPEPKPNESGTESIKETDDSSSNVPD